MSPRSRRDVVSAVGLAVLAIAYLVANRRYSLDTLATPGPGVFPLIVGSAMLVLASWQAAVAARQHAQTMPPSRPETRARATPLTLVALLVVYVIAADVIGFLAASFALVVVSSRLLGAQGWLRPAVLGLGVTVACHAIFIWWLKVPLPAGLLR